MTPMTHEAMYVWYGTHSNVTRTLSLRMHIGTHDNLTHRFHTCSHGDLLHGSKPQAYTIRNPNEQDAQIAHSHRIGLWNAGIASWIQNIMSWSHPGARHKTVKTRTGKTAPAEMRWCLKAHASLTPHCVPVSPHITVAVPRCHTAATSSCTPSLFVPSAPTSPRSMVARRILLETPLVESSNFTLI